MSKWTRRRVEKDILIELIRKLRNESVLPIDDTDFIELAVEIQHRHADKLQERLNKL